MAFPFFFLPSSSSVSPSSSSTAGPGNTKTKKFFTGSKKKWAAQPVYYCSRFPLALRLFFFSILFFSPFFFASRCFLSFSSSMSQVLQVLASLYSICRFLLAAHCCEIYGEAPVSTSVLSYDIFFSSHCSTAPS
jgi:hypothetical protein